MAYNNKTILGKAIIATRNMKEKKRRKERIIVDFFMEGDRLILEGEW